MTLPFPDSMPIEPQPPQSAYQIVVSLMTNGTITIHGPLDNGILCLGMLTKAIDLVNENTKSKANGVSPIVAAPPIPGLKSR